MARSKGAGKKRKAAVRKPATRRPSVKRAPKAPPAQAAPQSVQQYPCNVIVKKGAERLPVQVADERHHRQLVEQFGESSIEVQS